MTKAKSIGVDLLLSKSKIGMSVGSTTFRSRENDLGTPLIEGNFHSYREYRRKES